jgi:hypothetical protein
MIRTGDVVIYVLSGADAEMVNRRRTSGESIAERIRSGSWPKGAVAHIGVEVMAGQELPAMVLSASGNGEVADLKVFLNGSDDFWAPQRGNDEWKTPAVGTWHRRN